MGQSVVVKPLSANSGSPAAVQTLVSYMLGGGITVVPGSVQYTGATAASGIFVNGGTNLQTSIGINSGVVLTTGDARFVSGSATMAEDFPNKTTAFGAESSTRLQEIRLREARCSRASLPRRLSTRRF
jgi:hypothetical protein